MSDIVDYGRCMSAINENKERIKVLEIQKEKNGAHDAAFDVKFQSLRTDFENLEKKIKEKENDMKSLRRTLIISVVTILIGLAITFTWDRIMTPVNAQVPDETIDVLKSLVQEVKELKNKEG